MKNPKNILITGASSGIGEALALSYARPEVTLFLCAQNKERLEDVAIRCRNKGACVFADRIDVTDSLQMKEWIFKSDSQAYLDLVIANAGVSAGSSKDESITRHLFAVNVGGVLNTVLPALEKMTPRKKGQIALMSSLAGYCGLPSAPAYSATKNAVRAWGEALRGEYRALNIEINVICPGFVASRITDKNTFYMPFFMQAPQASKIIIQGLSKNKARITFPKIMALMAWFIACLPACVADIVLTKLPKK